MVLDELGVPVVLAPLAGGPATVDLAVAVSEAGGLGFLAAGYQPPDAVGAEIAELRSRTRRPFGVNVFVAPAAPADPAVVAAYAERLAGEGELGAPRFDDDGWHAKLAQLVEARPPVVSFVFGCPPATAVAALAERGTEVWATVTSAGEAAEALAAGVHGLVAQGYEAGGHRAAFDDADDDEPAIGLIALLQLLAERTAVPLVAAGGITSGRGLAAALAAGATAGALGTAFLRCPEAGTADAHREAIAGDAPTALTRAFTGRAARGIVNAFMRDHDAEAPRAYPEVHHLTAPLRRAARASGDAEAINLWAGQAHALATDLPAAEVVRRVVADARAAAARAGRLLGAA